MRKFVYIFLIFLIFIPIKSSSVISDELYYLPKDGFLYISISEPSIFSSKPEGSKGYFNLMLSDEMDKQLSSINAPFTVDNILEIIRGCQLNVGFYIEGNRSPFSAILTFADSEEKSSIFKVVIDEIIKGILSFGREENAETDLKEKTTDGFVIKELRYTKGDLNKKYYFALSEKFFIMSNFRNKFYETLDNINKDDKSLKRNKAIQETIKALGNEGDIFAFFITNIIKSKKKGFEKAIGAISKSDEQKFWSPLPLIIENSSCIGYRNITISDTNGPTDRITCLLHDKSILNNTLYSSENRHENNLINYLPENILLLMTFPISEDIGIPQDIIDESLLFTTYKEGYKIDKMFELKNAQMLFSLKEGNSIEDIMNFDKVEEYGNTNIYCYGDNFISVIRRAENSGEKEVVLYSKDEQTIKDSTDHILSGKTVDKTENFNTVLPHLERNTNLLIYVDTSLYPDLVEKDNLTGEQRIYLLKRALCEIGFGISVYSNDKFIVLDAYPQLLPKLIFLISTGGY